jgi:hypothetical protein
VPLIAVFTVIGLVAAPVSANRRQDAMPWASRQIGCPYTYGGTGPCRVGFDCSGLVVAAYAHVGMRLPRTTYGMLHSSAIVPQTNHPHPGNLVFFGSGHVALYYWRHVVLHAPQPGEKVQLTRWYPGSSWVPTGYYRVRDAGAGPMREIRRWITARWPASTCGYTSTPRCGTSSRTATARSSGIRLRDHGLARLHGRQSHDHDWLAVVASPVPAAPAATAASTLSYIGRRSARPVIQRVLV